MYLYNSTKHLRLLSRHHNCALYRFQPPPQGEGGHIGALPHWGPLTLLPHWGPLTEDPSHYYLSPHWGPLTLRPHWGSLTLRPHWGPPTLLPHWGPLTPSQVLVTGGGVLYVRSVCDRSWPSRVQPSLCLHSFYTLLTGDVHKPMYQRKFPL